MANKLTNNNSNSLSSSTQVSGNSGVINNGRSTNSQGQPRTNTNNNSRNTPFRTGIDHVDAILNQSGQSKSTSSSKPKRQPLRSKSPADPPPPLGDNAVNDDFDGYDTTRTFQFGNKTTANPGLNLTDLLQSPRLFSQLDSSQRKSNLQTSFNPSTSSISNVSLTEVMVSRRTAPTTSTPVAGTLAWLSDPTNLNGYHLYPDLKTGDDYDNITQRLCELANLDYYSTYRFQISLVGGLHHQQTGLPNLSSPDELVRTAHVFKNFVNEIARKFTNRFPTIFLSLLHPDPFNDPAVRDYFMQLINRDSGKRPTGLTPEERVRICSLLQTKVGDYNKANSFLAEVLRATISAQKSLFPKLHLLLQQNDPSIYDAHALFYGIKLEMAKGQEKLLKKHQEIYGRIRH